MQMTPMGSFMSVYLLCAGWRIDSSFDTWFGPSGLLLIASWVQMLYLVHYFQFIPDIN